MAAASHGLSLPLLSTGPLPCLGGGWRGWSLREVACHFAAMALGGPFTFLSVAFFFFPLTWRSIVGDEG